MVPLPLTDLVAIREMEIEKDEENSQFKSFLTHQPSKLLDETVHRLNHSVSRGVDCKSCGNCCRSLMVNVTDTDLEELAAVLDIGKNEFRMNYLEESNQGQMILKRQPCHFLSGNLCSIYDHRFSACRDFPHLQQDHFISRLFSVFMNYGRCPIIFNVLEQLKIETGFIQQPE